MQKLIARRARGHPSPHQAALNTTALVALLLAGCSEDGRELSPGEWERSVKVTRYYVPGAPGTTALRAQALLGQAQVNRICVTPANASRGIHGLTQTLQGRSCALRHLTLDSADFKGTLACAGLDFGTGAFPMKGRYSSEHLDFTLDGDVADARLPGGMAEVVIAVSARRVGECPS
jgi:Protein of unknown function (DUF3617)